MCTSCSIFIVPSLNGSILHATVRHTPAPHSWRYKRFNFSTQSRHTNSVTTPCDHHHPLTLSYNNCAVCYCASTISYIGVGTTKLVLKDIASLTCCRCPRHFCCTVSTARWWPCTCTRVRTYVHGIYTWCKASWVLRASLELQLRGGMHSFLFSLLVLHIVTLRRTCACSHEIVTKIQTWLIDKIEVRMCLPTSCRSLMGAGIFITAVVLGTVIFVSKKPYTIGKSVSFMSLSINQCFW